MFIILYFDQCYTHTHPKNSIFKYEILFHECFFDETGNPKTISKISGVRYFHC